MARKSLRPQLNQIRAWVRQGRTDAWIAHQLGVPASQLRDFRSRHGLTEEGEEPANDVDLRDEIEAEIEAELEEPEAEVEEWSTDEGEGDGDSEGAEGGEGEGGRRRRRRRRGRRGRGRKKPLEATFDQGEEEGSTDEGEGEGDGDSEGAEGGEGEGGRRRRRRRRGRRGRGRKKPLEATFDQGEEEGYGIWLDPSIKDDPTYTEHWQGQRALKVTIEPERIVLERVED